jgi:hypothetical protein
VRGSAEWLDVSAQRPCPICGEAEGCRVLCSGEFAACLVRPSERPLVSGGWLHAVGAVGLDTLSVPPV